MARASTQSARLIVLFLLFAVITGGFFYFYKYGPDNSVESLEFVFYPVVWKDGQADKYAANLVTQLNSDFPQNAMVGKFRERMVMDGFQEVPCYDDKYKKAVCFDKRFGKSKSSNVSLRIKAELMENGDIKQINLEDIVTVM